ncbi:type II/IV secretion system protein [bacterium]|nr:MAG: type II/IV secretion system protein [bacterium]
MPVQEIGNILLNSKAITKEQLEFALVIQRNINPSQRLGRILKYYNFASDEEMAQALAKQVGWRYFNKKYVLNLLVIEKIGLDFLMDRVFLPVETEKGLGFVFAYPFDIEATDLLTREGLRDKEFYIGSESAIRNHLELLKRLKKRKEIDKKISLIKETGIVGDELKELLDELLDDAIIHNATDIHIEPEEKISTIRFRIDGILYFKFCIPLEVHNNLINVVFSKAEITVSDFYRFHDARFQHAYSDHPVDIRVSCIPSIFGPALVLRLLDANKSLITLEDLGFDALHFDNINHIVRKPHGIIIVTGPTGSGKTTTLYAILNQLKSLSTKVITIEDPVEIKMPLINQVQINEKQGITFAHATRAFLRHDPNIILIGEIRDHDTAQEAIRASITGHRVLSTLHTNTAVDSIYRLHDLGIDLAHIANSILCVISQRLIRKLCPFCRKRVTVKKDAMPDFFRKLLEEDKDEMSVYKARGCDYCQAGYKGRTVIAEILSFNDDIRDMVSSGKLDLLRHKREEETYLTLEQDAAMLILKGVTSFEEVERVVG